MTSWTNWGRGNKERKIKFPPQVIALVERRQGGKYCVMCRVLKIVTPEDIPLELDHKLPLSKGGDNNHLNLQWLCRSHNRGRRAESLSRMRRPAWERRRDS